MATNLALDDRLIEEARRSGGHRTKKEAVTKGFSKSMSGGISKLAILEDFGTVDFDPEYDYKAGAEPKTPMMVLVDTPVWSLALRRRAGDLSKHEVRLTQD